MNTNVVFVNGYYKSIEINFIKNKFSICKKIICKDKIKQSTDFLFPAKISNAIVNFENHRVRTSLTRILKNLESLNCRHFVINIIDKCDSKSIKYLFEKFNKFNIHEVLLIIKYSDFFFSEEFEKLAMLTNRYRAILIFNSPFNKNFENLFFYFKKDFEINFNKNQNEFRINKLIYTESCNHHLYFNRKIFIDEFENIKNAPECDEIFGNIKEINNPEELKKIISTPEFQKYWSVHKDIQDVCKDCEFRYMCVDNKIPYQRTENEWYHKIECNYNPYIAKWEGEEGYKTLSECGVISNENGFSIDHDKIAEINKELWGE